MNLQTPLSEINCLSLHQASVLAKACDFYSVEDILFYFPLRFLDRRYICQISNITSNMSEVQCVGKVISKHNEVGSGNKQRLVVLISDGSGFLSLVFFSSLKYINTKIQIGHSYLVFGKVKLFNNGYQIAHPEIEPWHGDNLRGLMPIYRSTELLKRHKITNKVLSTAIQSILTQLSIQDIEEIIPDWILKDMNLPNRFEAFKSMHNPRDLVEFNQAKNRFIFEEFLSFQLRISLSKMHRRTSFQGYKLTHTGQLFQDFYAKYLPFNLTKAQQRVIKEIWKDLRSGIQMNRLLQGDVGSGKTMVALISALFIIGNGLQCVIVAPTSTLATQHFNKMQSYLSKLPIRMGFLHGQSKTKERRELMLGLENGDIQLLIGTHAVLESMVKFKNLGLAIIDEQHKFGVEQRSELWKKCLPPPHMLVMTATPIPRTLAMSLYGDLDISNIDELPPRRGSIQTIYRNESYRSVIYDFIKKEIAKGHQVYIVFPVIEDSPSLELENLICGYERIKEIFPMPHYRISLTHGRQSSEEKELNMQRFIKNDTQIMVATTVIEVGIDVPNATVMLIENAERFGLSQLHQLRGRIGRGSAKSYCILLSKLEISQKARKRLQLITTIQDGFLLAEEDLRLRGPGDVGGTKQSGSLVFRFGDILTDKTLLSQAQKYAQILVLKDNNLSLKEHTKLNEYIFQKRKSNFWSHIS